MTLIEGGFSGWYKKYSAIALAAITALQLAWGASPDLRDAMTPYALVTATGVLAALGFVGRFIDQSLKLMPQGDVS
jgi:uncharacterized membrane protein (UPF0136 family)